MEFQELWTIIRTELPKTVQSHKGLSYFIKHRAKFEGWLKVELCEILSRTAENIVPEKDRIDIVFNDWALELKTVNTNYRYQNIENKTRPITKNIQGIIKDIKDLADNNAYSKKAILFVVFPLSLSTHGRYWEKHLTKITGRLKQLEYEEFRFSNGAYAVLYCGLI